MREIVETVVDVSPPRFKPGDRVVVTGDKFTGKNGMTGTVDSVKKNADSATVYVRMDLWPSLPPLMFYCHELELAPSYSLRVWQIVDKLTEAHTTTEVIKILEDYRLIQGL